MPSESTKRCTACGVEKNLAEFYDRRDRPNSEHGKVPRCKPCLSEYNGVQRAKHRDRRLAAKRAYYQANKATHLERGRQYRSENAEAVKAARTRWRRANPELIKLATQRYKERTRRRVFSHYSEGEMCCACCGEARYRFLALDHINGGGNAHRRSLGRMDSLSMAVWAIQNNFPPIFRVLCFNCNQARAYYGMCPHDEER
jgi:hypothetical protein